MEPAHKRSRRSYVEYIVSIEVLDTKGIGLDANIKLAFYGNEVWTEQTTIKDALKPKTRGKETFKVSMPAMNDIQLMSLTRTTGLLTSWLIGKIEVERQSTDEKYVFPFNKCIEKGKEYTIYEKKYATCLSQNDPDKELRSVEIQEQAKKYGYFQTIKGGPVQVREVPHEEWFSVSYTEYFLKRFARAKFDSILERLGNEVKHIFSTRWKSLGDIAERLYFTDEFPKPELCAPVALFFVNKKNRLMPLAIRLEQTPSPNNPVFLPTDNKYLWMMAKMWFNNSDAAYHESVSHLGFTHLIIEGFVITTHRNLGDRHPLYKLLLPHFLFLIEINALGLKKLIDPNGWVDEAMNIGREGMLELIAKRMKTWKLGVDGNLPRELESRGVFDDVLPHYYYKDDALDLWNVIMKYVTSYVTLYYGEQDASTNLKEDFELQNWANAIVAPRSKGQGILGVPGVPDEETLLKTKDDLCNILTSIIFISSVAHASVNFMQYEQYGFPPAYPSYLKGTPPTSKKQLYERDVLHALPDFKTSVDVMDITQVLSGFGTHKLGDFPTPYITDPTALPIVKQFQKDLAQLSDEIGKKNRTRDPVYDYLNPNNIPNSISI